MAEFEVLRGECLSFKAMKKIEYKKPAVRVRPMLTDGTLLYDTSFGKGGGGTIAGEPFAKEGGDLNYNPEFKNVWED